MSSRFDEGEEIGARHLFLTGLAATALECAVKQLIVRELGVDRLLHLADTRPELLLDRLHVGPQRPRPIQRLAFLRG